MPIIRKIIPLGNSKAITIPKTWLILKEQESGQSIDSVTIEVNGALVVKPFLKRKKEATPT